MASSRFVDPPDELRACSEAFHAEAMKHLDAVFEEQSYGETLMLISLIPSRITSHFATRMVLTAQP